MKEVCHSLWIIMSSLLVSSSHYSEGERVFVFAYNAVSVELTCISHFADILWGLCTLHGYPSYRCDALTDRGQMVEQLGSSIAFTNGSDGI